MTDLIQNLVLLRFATGLLGQKDGRGWWGCEFLSEAGLSTLDYNFPRSPLAAGLTATSLAAKRIHDERIGKTGVIHLFRLDPDLETRVSREISRNAASLIGLAPRSPDFFMSELLRLAGGEIDSPAGPVQVGLTEDAGTSRGVGRLAAHYHAAFRSGIQVFPYFAARQV
jgi:hypothetical protein